MDSEVDFCLRRVDARDDEAAALEANGPIEEERARRNGSALRRRVYSAPGRAEAKAS